jgi:5'-deoxynucleotidase YfbR-like HD superfamily hydrolase
MVVNPERYISQESSYNFQKIDYDFISFMELGYHVENLCSLLKKYNNVYRATTQQSKLDNLCGINPNYIYNPNDNIVRESLMEHVGSLPIIASFLHPYLESKVNLGRSLQMLAIHDIGETVLGDINTFLKKETESLREIDVALKIIHPDQKDILIEFENLSSDDAKFARSIDKIAPDLIDFMTDKEVTINRFRILLNKSPEEILPLIRAKKTPFMEWSPFMKDFHFELMSLLEKKLKDD